MHRSRLLFAGVALVAIVVGGFFIGRAIKGGPARAQDPAVQADGPAHGSPPPGDSTPVPGATPDKSLPDWYIPYLNQERNEPKFQGQLNGITLGVSDGPTPSCTKTIAAADWEPSIAGTPFDLHFDSLPKRLNLHAVPQVGVCGDDGRTMWIIARFEVSAGDGVSGSTGVVQISRWESVRWYPQKFLATKVSAGTVAGRPAVFADVGTSGIGQTAVFVVDDEIHGSTMVLSSNVSLDYLKTIAEALYK